jgi:predicted Zn-dependent protease
MINNKKAEKLIEQTLDYAKDKTQGAEVIISSSDVATSRFANNSMTQNQSPERTEISLRVIKNGRQARLSTDDLSSSNIEKLVDDALAILKFLEKDETLLQLPGHKKGKDDHHKVDRFDKLTAELSAEQRAKAVGQIIKVAKSSGLQAAIHAAYLHRIKKRKRSAPSQ